MILNEDYFLNEDVCFLAKNLLGKMLITKIDNFYTSGIIVETEAYRGPDDKASHSYLNKITPRNTTMYNHGGCSYVYICYGVHYLFNVVTAPADKAHAVLVRAIEPIEGIEIMMKRRSHATFQNTITKGPGSLSMAFGINKLHNNILLHKVNSTIQIHDIQKNYLESEIDQSTRIGVESAGESALWPWRFFIKDSKFVSAHKKSSN
ncbi:MAG: DNA-3-methyladenine glycosylase [Saprospiraceae bacterium]